MPPAAEPSTPNLAPIANVLIAIDACSLAASAVTLASFSAVSVTSPPSAVVGVSCRYARAATGFSWVR
jgi:predicted ribosomally synthesized peptide with SipW-like signal peptide